MNDLQQAPVPFHFLRLPEVLATVGVSKSTLYAWIKEGKFPRPVHLSATAAVWVSIEVAEWMQARVAERDANIAAA